MSAIEIESRLLQSDIVSECAVIGVADEKYGEEIVAYIVKDSKCTLSDSEAQKALDSHIRNLMDSYKIPRVWRFASELPRNHMGKLNKPELRKNHK